MARLLAAALLLPLLATPARASIEGGRAAEARGALREAMIQYRDAVRRAPAQAAARAALAQASLDRGDGDTAEREARAALDHGYDPVVATAMLARAYLLQGRGSDLLRDMPVPAGPPALAAEVAAARIHALLGLGSTEEAATAAAEALRANPATVSVLLAAAAVALARGDRDAAEARTDEALAIAPTSLDALLRKGSMMLLRGDAVGAEATFLRAIAAEPGSVEARLRRAEALIRLDRPGGARQEVELVLREVSGSAAALYLRAVILIGEEDWRGAEDMLQRMGPALDTFPDGLLLLAATKRALGQTAQAEEAARRYLSQRPGDPRGVAVLASILVGEGRAAEATAVLERVVARGDADAAALEMLARHYALAGRQDDAVAMLEQAARAAPQDAAIRTRLAAARLARGDAQGPDQAAEAALRLAPVQPAAQDLLAGAALARGDVAAAEAALAAADGPRSEARAVLEGTIRLIRLDLRGARREFETLIRANADTIAGRLGLARVAAIQGAQAEVLGLLGEVLRRQPDNLPALRQLTRMASAPDGAPALARLEVALAEAPGEAALGMALAEALIRSGQPGRAVAVLEAPALAARLPASRRLAALTEAHAAAQDWPRAMAAGRAALDADPASIPARLSLARVLEAAGQAPAAEALLRTPPALRQPVVMRALIGLVQRQRGIEAALAVVADLPTGEAEEAAAVALLHGDLLLQARRPQEAAALYAEAGARWPATLFALREAMAREAAGESAAALRVLDRWLDAQPQDAAALSMRAQFAIAAEDWALAIRLLDVAVRVSPLDAVALNNLAWLLARDEAQPPEDRAEALAERAYYLMPNRQTADTLGWILFRRGDARRAVPLLRIAAADDDPASRLRLARALEAGREPLEALRQLEALPVAALPPRDRLIAEALRAQLGAGR